MVGTISIQKKTRFFRTDETEKHFLNFILCHWNADLVSKFCFFFFLDEAKLNTWIKLRIEQNKSMQMSGPKRNWSATKYEWLKIMILIEKEEKKNRFFIWPLWFRPV